MYEPKARHVRQSESRNVVTMSFTEDGGSLSSADLGNNGTPPRPISKSPRAIGLFTLVFVRIGGFGYENEYSRGTMSPAHSSYFRAMPRPNSDSVKFGFVSSKCADIL